MTKPYSLILREVGDAVDYVRSNGGSIPDTAIDEQIEAGVLLADLPDDATSNDWFNDELSPAPPNVVRAASVEELVMLHQALGYIHHGIDPNKVKWGVNHERIHNTRADRIGFRQSVMGLAITESFERRSLVPQGYATEISFGWRPFSEQAGPLCRVSKLALASMVAGPLELSKGDQARLNAMGYTGREDVARRIITATDPKLSSLPLPEFF